MYRPTLFLFLSLLFPMAAIAQSVPIKTIPVAEGDQFWLFPSERAGMGGVGIALDDRLNDPFVNPAKGVNISGAQFVSTPAYYGFGPMNGASGEGSGRTLPVGGLVHQNGAFAGVMMAFQELVSPRNQTCCIGRFADVASERSESSISTNNLYFFGFGGLEIPDSDVSVGVSAFHAQLGGMEGVNLLYSADGVRQDGSMQQYRAGFYRDWGPGHAAELVLMHHRFEMTHRMDEFTGQSLTFREEQDEFTGRSSSLREEHDETRSFAVQAGYRHAYSTGWSLGGRIVGDWKWHPKIPNYDLMQIPRDPGHSAAYNFGLGFATTSGAATFGVDVIYEPIWSHTWADALETTETANGGVVYAGSKTIENYFVFNNVRFRMGVQREGERMNFSVGIDMHHISYNLDQMDFVENRRRLLDQHWTEWTLSSGLGTDFSGFRLQYTGRLTLGTGTPGVQQRWGGGRVGGMGFADAGADWVVAPNGPLVLDETKVLSHQLALVVPLAN